MKATHIYISSRLNLRKAQDFKSIRTRGFSLVELMIALAVASVVVAAIFSIHVGLARSYTTQNVAADIQQVVRAGIDYISEDLMMAGLDSAGSAGTGIEAATATNIRFTLDRNMNGIIDSTSTNLEDITYTFNAGTNRLNHTTPSTGLEDLIDNVINATFIYLDADGNDLGDPVPAADLADIRTVLISITVQEPAGRGGMVNRTYSNRIRCRNLGI
jgi:prepilin-type N-terminal cleavage/methylation domain-containing protein